MKLRIGFDFDNVIANTNRAKREYAAKNFGIYLDSRKIGEKGYLEETLNEQQVKELKSHVYSSFNLKSFYGAIKHMKKILEKGHDTTIISYRRRNPGNKIIKNNLIDWGIYSHEIMIICTDNRPKRKFCYRLDAFFDDQLDNLEDLKGEVKHRVLFSPYFNEAPERIALSKSWKENYRIIQKLSREK